MRTFFGNNNNVRLFVMAMVAMTLAAGCADELETVPRPQDAAVSDQVDGAPSKDVALDQATKDVGDDVEMADKATPDVVFVTDALDVIAADRGDVPAAADRADAPTFTDGPRDVADSGDTGAPCPPDRTTTCGSVCVDVQTDATNCGACFNACALANAMPACTAGRCTIASCNAGFRDCDGNAANGCEANLQTDARNCGTCANACVEPMPLCSSGRCIGGVCPMGMTRCDSSCVDTQTDVRNCNGCGAAFVCPEPPNAAATCVAGRCGFTCDAGFHVCTGVCVSNAAVATCGSSCTPCVAPANAVATCNGTACGFTCNAGFRDCDGVASNGCEVETAASVTNCGACGTACTLTNATPTCAAGRCTVASCATGFANCDGNDGNGCETDTRTSMANCGRCGGVCATGGTCDTGTCTLTIQVARGGHLGSSRERSFAAAYQAADASDLSDNAAVFTFFTAGFFAVGRGWLLVPVPRGTVVSATFLFSARHYGDRNPGMTVQGVSFTPTSVFPASPLVVGDYNRSHWGVEPFLSEAIPVSALTVGTEVRRDLNAAGLRYLQAANGGQALLGLRTSLDLGGTTEPSGDYSGAEFGTPPPNVRVIFRYTP